MLRAAAAAGGAGAAPFCLGLPLAGLHRAPLASRPAPLPALPRSVPSLLAGSCPLQSLAHVGRPGPLPLPAGHRPRHRPRGSPGPLLPPPGSCPALPRRVPAWPRLPRRAVPGLGLRQLEGLLSGSLCVCMYVYICICISPGVIGTSGWGREPDSAPLDASGQAAARCGRAVEPRGAAGAARAAGRECGTAPVLGQKDGRPRDMGISSQMLVPYPPVLWKTKE
nr:translation initiation factor IF-2 isoform X1 [Taeniopygia guttata]